MAIINNGLLGSSRNKVGSLVTYRLKGQDIARAKAAQVSNPRSLAQMQQRVKLANLVGMYRANRSWMDGLAFSTRPQQWSDYNAFVSANIATNRIALTKEQAAAGTTIVAPYIVSRGSLPTIEVNPTTANVWQTNIGVGSLTIDAATTTVADLSQAILANNNGLQQGLQLSLVMNYQQQSGSAYYVTTRYYEVILNPNDSSLLSSRMDLQHVGVSGGNLAYTRGETDPIVGFAFILSLTESNKTRVSTQRLVLTSETLYNIFADQSQQDEAIQSYGATMGDPFLVSNYGGGIIDSGVDILANILTAQINNETPKASGEYLGAIGTENEFTIGLNLSQTLTTPPASVTISGAGGGEGNEATTTNVAVNGAQVVATFPANAINPSTKITNIRVTLASGVIVGIDFKPVETYGGDVTE